MVAWRAQPFCPCSAQDIVPETLSDLEFFLLEGPEYTVCLALKIGLSCFPYSFPLFQMLSIQSDHR